MSVEKDEKDEPSEASLEKGTTPIVHTTRGNDLYHFDLSDLDCVQRRLKQCSMFKCLFFLLAYTFKAYRLDP